MDVQGFLNKVPGCAGYRADNHPVFLDQAVHQARFAHIGSSHNRQYQTVSENMGV